MNRNDRRVMLAALVVALVATIALLVTGNDDATTAANAVRKDSTAVQRSHQSRQQPYYQTSQRPAETFAFDPNTADSTQLLRLGLQPWQVRNIYKYRAHGGVYRRKEDFARLYGLTVKDYRRLEPYIRISNDYQPAATLVGEAPRAVRDMLRYPRKIDSTARVALNTADTALLRRVPGIGSYYAREIVRRRQWLGGFANVDQLDEIEGFPAAAKHYFVVSAGDVQRLNINQLSLQELRRHPYINYYQAKAIIEYRRLHGPIHSLNDLRFSRDFTPEIIARLTPYVSF